MTRCDAPGVGGETPAGKFGDWFDPDADAAWRAANLEALELGHRWLGTEHLLLGLLHGPGNDPVRSLLDAHDVTVDKAREALIAHADPPHEADEVALLATLGIDLAAVRAGIEQTFGADAIDRLYARRRRDGHRLDRGPLCGMMLAPRLKRALEHARRAAKTDRRQRASTVDLLGGMLAEDDTMALRLLRAVGVDPRSLQAQLKPRVAG